MLQVEQLRFSYRAGTQVLKDISFTLPDGEILCLLGPNGTGKTTLLRCLLALLRPSGGTIQIDGRDITNLPDRKRARLMAYVPQAAAIAFPYTAHEVVLMGRTAHYSMGGSAHAADHAAAEQAMARLDISHLSGRLFHEISGGERQMVLLARAMAQNAKTLIMDEPTANLDYSNQVRMLKVIRHLAGEGYSILMTSHFPDHAFLACHQAALMKEGVIAVQGPPDQVVTTEHLSRLYGTTVHVAQAQLPGGRAMKVCIPDMDDTI